MLIDMRLDPRRPKGIFNHLALTEAHSEVQRMAFADNAESSAGALGPVFAIVLLEYAGRSEGVNRILTLRFPLVLREILVKQSEPLDLRLGRALGQA
jgi:hypothetical protein